MLEQLVPSIELTGGPWYNGNELDTEFIEQLLGLAQKIVRAKVNCTSRKSKEYHADTDAVLP